MLYLKTFIFHIYERKIKGFLFIISLSFFLLSSFDVKNFSNFFLNFKNYITLLSNQEIKENDLALKDLVIKKEEKPTQKYLFAYNVFLKSSKEEEKLYVINMFKSIFKNDVLVLENNIIKKNFFYDIFFIFNLIFLIVMMLNNFSKKNLSINKINFLFKSFLIGILILSFVLTVLNYSVFLNLFKTFLNISMVLFLFFVLWIRKIA